MSGPSPHQTAEEGVAVVRLRARVTDAPDWHVCKGFEVMKPSRIDELGSADLFELQDVIVDELRRRHWQLVVKTAETMVVLAP